MGWSTNFTVRLCKLVNASLMTHTLNDLNLQVVIAFIQFAQLVWTAFLVHLGHLIERPTGKKLKPSLASCWKRFWFAATKLIFFPENIWPFIDAKTRKVFFIEINQVERVLRRTKLFAKYVSLTKLAELILVFFRFLKMGHP